MRYAEHELSIVAAREKNLGQINALIARSKAFWHWPADYLERALQLHRILPSELKRIHGFELWTREALVAFASLDPSRSTPLLDNLWVEPEYIGRGIGALACRHIFRSASQRGWSEILVMPDRPSEGFYAKMGFTDSGQRVPSRIPGGPPFSIYRVSLLHERKT